MVTTELRIHRFRDQLQFERRMMVPTMQPMIPEPEYSEVPDQMLRRVMRKIAELDTREGPIPRNEILDLGRFIDNWILPPGFREALQAMHEAPVLIVTGDAPIPWELAGVSGEGDDATNLGERVPIGRCLAAANVPVQDAAKPGEASSPSKPARALLVVDPCERLPDARREARVLMDYLETMGWEGDFLAGHDATHDALFDALASGDYAFLHFCCDVEAHSSGGAVLTGDDDLTAAVIRPMELSGCVVYLNACGSAMHRPAKGHRGHAEPPVAGLAQAFLQAGAVGVIGSLWRACDRTSRFFAQRFYGRLAQVGRLGDSLLAARRLASDPNGVEDLEAATLAGFVLYGDPQLGIAINGGEQAEDSADVAAPEDQAATATTATEPAGWPPEEWFEADAAAALNEAADAARKGDSMLTSMHLASALLAEGRPLAEWMRENNYPLGVSRQLSRALLDTEDDEQQVRDASEEIGPATAPDLSPTVEGLMKWAETAEEDHPISLRELTGQFTAGGGGIMGELLKTLSVPLADYPDARVRLPRSQEVEEAISSAETTAIMWGEGMMTSSHLMLGVLEAGGGPLANHIRRAGHTTSQVSEALKEQIMDASPTRPATEVEYSFNVSRILLKAEERARETEREQLELTDVIDAAATLTAGGVGKFLKSIGYAPVGGPALRGRGTVPPEPFTDQRVVGLLSAAARCMNAANHMCVGTPHLVATALHFHEGLRAAVMAQGADPEQVLQEILRRLGVPEGVAVFDERFAADEVALSHNLSMAAERARQMAGGSPSSAEQLLIAALTQTTGMIGALLQEMRIEPYQLARALEEPDVSSDQ